MRPNSSLRPVRAVLFDLDGTLCDTFPDLLAAIDGAAGEMGLEAADPVTLRPLVSLGGREMLRGAYPEVSEDQRDHLRMRFLALYRIALAVRTRPFPGMDEVLEDLEGRGIPWGIVTNKHQWLTEPLLERLGLQSRAACVVSGDTASHAKPHPEPLLLACRLGHMQPHHTVYLGDAEHDMVAARRAGMRGAVAGWGYLPTDADPETWQGEGVFQDPGTFGEWVKHHCTD